MVWKTNCSEIAIISAVWSVLLERESQAILFGLLAGMDIIQNVNLRMSNGGGSGPPS